MSGEAQDTIVQNKMWPVWSWLISGACFVSGGAIAVLFHLVASGGVYA